MIYLACLYKEQDYRDRKENLEVKLPVLSDGEIDISGGKHEGYDFFDWIYGNG